MTSVFELVPQGGEPADRGIHQEPTDLIHDLVTGRWTPEPPISARGCS